jgi:hypothetical protein
VCLSHRDFLKIVIVTSILIKLANKAQLVMPVCSHDTWFKHTVLLVCLPGHRVA